MAKAASTRLERAAPWRSAIVVFAIGLAVRTSLVFFTTSYIKTARYELEGIAVSMAIHGTLADPYLVPTGPSAHAAPAYALLLASIYWLFGTGIAGELVKQLGSAAAASAQYALLPVISPTFGMSRYTGLAAGLFGAVFPLKFSTEVLGDWEAPYAALALVLLAWGTMSAWRDRRFGIRRGFFHGIGWGLSLLCAPAFFPVLAVWLALGYLSTARRNPRPYLAYAIALLAAVGLCLAPWAIRNERQLGAPIFTRTNFGLELYVSNNDLAGPLEVENYRHGVYHALHPLLNLREAQDVRAMGEVVYNRDRLHRALDWIRSHPGHFARLTAERALYTWFPKTSVRWRDAVFVPLVIAGVLGLAGLWRREPYSALMLAGAMAAFTPLYCLIQVNVRYRYPIDWIFLLAASYFFASVLGVGRPRRAAASHRVLPQEGGAEFQ